MSNSNSGVVPSSELPERVVLSISIELSRALPEEELGELRAGVEAALQDLAARAPSNVRLRTEVSCARFPRFLPDRVRKAILEDPAFLRDCADAAITGDGMDLEHAAEALDGDDEFLLNQYMASCADDRDRVLAMIAQIGGSAGDFARQIVHRGMLDDLDMWEEED